MDKVKKAWNWRMSPEKMRSVKARALRGMAAFLALMVCCTIISRAADSMTVPIVSAEAPKRAAIDHKFTVDGTLETVGGVPVIPPADLMVTSMLVELGDRVQAGQLLFTCDISQASREIAAKRLDIQSLQTELSTLEQNRAIDKDKEERDAERDAERAQQDYGYTEEEQDLKVEEAGERVRQARVALRKYDSVDRDDYDSDENDYTEDEYNRLRSEYRAAQIAYEQAVSSRDEALRKAQRAIDDLGQEEKVDSSEDLKRLQIQKAQIELSTLQQSLANGGQVYAPVDGIITKLNLEAGKRTTSEAAATITDDAGMRFSTKIDEEQKKHVQPGDLIALTLSGEKTAIKDLSVLTVLPDAENAGQFLVTAELPAEKGSPGLGGKAEFTRKSEVYDTCVPLSALYAEGEKYYVMVVRETESTLGKEYVAERVDVTLTERNETMAAVSGPLGRDTQVIRDTDKPVRDGDRIRLDS